jgi:hypothetical protein
VSDRAALLATLDGFLDALARRRPHDAALAPEVRMTEDNHPIPSGAGLWGAATRIDEYRIVAADTDTGQVGFVGLIWRGDEASICGIRLRTRSDGLIDEVEIIRGPGRFPGASGVDARSLGPVRPVFAGEIAPAQRMDRAALAAAAAGYYAAVNQSQPDLAPLDPAGVRIEVGTQITSNPAFHFEFYAAADGGAALPNFGEWSAREQFQRGLWNADGVTDERYPLVDRTTGLVFAFTAYRPWHKRFETEVEGVGVVGPRIGGRRVALNMLEAFKIEAGTIREMESVWTIEPAEFRSVWTK